MSRTEEGTGDLTLFGQGFSVKTRRDAFSKHFDLPLAQDATTNSVVHLQPGATKTAVDKIIQSVYGAGRPLSSNAVPMPMPIADVASLVTLVEELKVKPEHLEPLAAYVVLRFIAESDEAETCTVVERVEHLPEPSPWKVVVRSALERSLRERLHLQLSKCTDPVALLDALDAIRRR